MEKLPGQSAPYHFMERVLVPNNYNPFTFNFFVDFNPPPAAGEQYQILYGSQAVARFIAGHDPLTGESFLESVYILDGYEIVRTSPYEGSGGKPEGFTSEIVNDRDGGSLVLTQPAIASPNPFIDALDVFPGQPAAESIHLQMYNLSGQNVLDQQLPGGQARYSLPTTNLSPGLYLLRIEADGKVQTLKVVKSE